MELDLTTHQSEKKNERGFAGARKDLHDDFVSLTEKIRAQSPEPDVEEIRASMLSKLS